MERDGYKVLVDLDTILDTRLGTVGLLDLDIGQSLATNRDYVSRETDMLSKIDPRIDDKLFRDRYLKRNEMTLSKSVMTDIPYHLGLGMEELVKSNDIGLIKGAVEIHINVYPYVLTEDVRRLISLGLKQYIPDPVRVSTVYTDPYGLSPGVLKSKYDEWYAYDIDQWLGIHQDKILTSILKSFIITLPRLSTTGVIPEDVDIDPWSAKELVFSEFFRMVHINASYYTYNYEMTEFRSDQSRSSIQSSAVNGTSP